MNLPAPFADYTRSLLGDEEYNALVDALQQEPPVSIRLNKLKMESSAWRVSGRHSHSPLSTLRSSLLPVAWSSEGVYLDERLTFTFDPLFHAGCYYVQEASSMFVEQALRQYVNEPIVMLDLCAAPGGKSTHARSVLPEGSLLVANEVMRNRSQVLAENLAKWGHPDVMVTNNDPADFSALPSFFDVILTDVPCSGEGMFRKDPVAIEEWTPENVEICWQRQRRIIADIWPCLKPGGILIYSTCTFNTKEDEENVRWIQQEFGAELLPLEVRKEWNITGCLLKEEQEATAPQEIVSIAQSVAVPQETVPVYHFFPHKTKGEGFFLAVLRKPCSEADENETEKAWETVCSQKSAISKSAIARAAKKKGKHAGKGGTSVAKEWMNVARSWVSDTDHYSILADAETVYAFPNAHLEELEALRQNLKVIQSGVSIGEVKGRDLIPAHALALCPLLLRDGAFVVEDISYEQAIAYLRKEAIVLPAAVERGFVLLTYRGVPLGFVKNIGNRANNLYPQEWRIRSGYLPEELRIL